MTEQKVRMVYAGRRLTAKDTIGYCWLELGDDGEPIPNDGLWKKQLARNASVGAVFEFTRSPTGGVYTSGKATPVYVEHLPDHDAERIAWEAMDADHSQIHATLQVAKNAKDQSLIREALLPIRLAMERAPRQLRRSAIVSAVQQELWRPLTKDERKAAGL